MGAYKVLYSIYTLGVYSGTTSGMAGQPDAGMTVPVAWHRAQIKSDTGVTARVWCKGGIDRKRNSTINLTTDSGACY